MRRIVLATAALAAGLAMAEEARVSIPAELGLKEAGLSIGPKCFLPGWQVCGCQSAGVNSGGEVMPFKLALGSATLAGKASFARLAQDRVSARWFLAADRTVKVEELMVSVAIPFDVYLGGARIVNGREMPFPAANAEFQFGYGERVREVSFKDAKGKVRATLTFDRGFRILFQDNSRFQSRQFEMRLLADVRTLEPGVIYDFGLTVSGPDAVRLVVPEPVTLKAGDGWLPFSAAVGVKEGSALDFSRICGLDAPAGKYGRVIAKNGHFEFERKPGVPQRFYGVNLCFGANYYQTKAEADHFAAMLARLGYNAVRLHHHDGLLVQDAADGTTVNPARMAELDALVAALVERGIYVTTDFYVSRQVPFRQVGVDRDGGVEMQDFKNLVRTNDVALANLKRFVKAWFEHVNPHTGRRWADEPGVAWVSLVNENCADNMRRIPDKEMADEIAAENRFFAAMRDFVRDDLRSSVLLTDLNGWSANTLWAACRRNFDYVDMHFYVDHPRFLEKPWRLPSECANANPLLGAEPNGVSFAGRCRLADKPFTITEWNFSGPGRFRGVGGIITGAWAARHDWDGLWRFAWSHDIGGVRQPERKPMDYFNLAGDPLMLASERATMCLFLRRDLRPGDARALTVDGKKGTMAIDTARTCGAFAEGGPVRAGILSADLGAVPATVWASALDDLPLAESRRILFTHLTDVQNSGATYADDSLRILRAWGGLPHLMREGRASVSLRLAAGAFEVHVLNADGSRRGVLPAVWKDGALTFTADVGRDRAAASYLYEIVRK